MTKSEKPCGVTRTLFVIRTFVIRIFLALPVHSAAMIRTKIVATMGPACGDVETLYRLFEAGGDVCRVNFSHRAVGKNPLMLRDIREGAGRYTHPVPHFGGPGGAKIPLGGGAGGRGFR